MMTSRDECQVGGMGGIRMYGPDERDRVRACEGFQPCTPVCREAITSPGTGVVFLLYVFIYTSSALALTIPPSIHWTG